MGFVVKNTTKCGLLDLLCPHSCRGCGCLGAVLCERCKKYMLENYEAICPICKKSFAKTLENVGSGAEVGKKCDAAVNNLNKQGARHWKCEDCEVPVAGLWAVGWREGALEKLVEEYKYQSVRAMGPVLAELLDEALPKELEEMTVVPLPTIGRHVRERGLDHTWEVAKKLARRRGWKCERLIARAADTVQVGAKVAEREAQAKRAYVLNGAVAPEKRYLLLDDVWTTGATMRAAVKVLRDAGVSENNIYVAVVTVSRGKEVA